MSWDASIVSTARDYFNVKVTVQYTDGNTTLTKDYEVTDQDSLNNAIDQQITQLNSSDDVLNQTATGIFTPVNTGVPVISPPVTIDPAVQAFMDALNSYRQYQKAVALGLLPANDPGVTSATSTLQGLFNINYLSLL
jgi:hypothetical protein